MRAGELNDKEVPGVTVPVLVTASEGLADGAIKAVSFEGEMMRCWDENVPGTPRSQPFDERAGNYIE